MTKKEIDEMRQLAYNLCLVGWQRLQEDSEETIERVCNGIGPSWFPAVIRQAIDKLHPSLKVVAMIHDLDYYHGDGTYDDFTRANKAFGTNGVRVADATYGWYDPRRYLARHEARKFEALCAAFGWPAYAGAIKEREKDMEK